MGVINGHSGKNIWCLALKKDASLFVTGAGDNSLRIWNTKDIVSGRDIVQNKFTLPQSQPRCILFDYAKESFYVGCFDGYFQPNVTDNYIQIYLSVFYSISSMECVSQDTCKLFLSS